MKTDSHRKWWAAFVLLAVSCGNAQGNIGTYVRCTRDYVDDRSMTGHRFQYGNENSVTKCIPACASLGFTYAGLRDTDCFCDEIPGKHRKTYNSNCNMPCPGDSSQTCGGEERLSVWQTDGAAAVDGGWSDWVTGECSATCGTGQANRTRECDDPEPQNGGLACEGGGQATEPCETNQDCPVDGSWSEWGTWGSCSATCGVGNWVRSRLCDGPAPENGGADCDGHDTDAGICNSPPCPGPMRQRYGLQPTGTCKHLMEASKPLEGSLTTCVYVCTKLEQCIYLAVREDNEGLRNTCYFLQLHEGGFAESIDKCYAKAATP